MANADDITKKPEQELAAPQAAPEKSEPEKKDDPDAKRFKTAGEKIHKWSTYLSVDWIFNAATGVGFGYWGNFSKAGKQYWSGPITDGFKKALKPIIKNEEQLAKSAHYGNIFVSIIAGGMFTIPPLLALEHKKVKEKIIKFWDKKVYGPEAVENDPKLQEAYKAMDDAPKKDFTSGMISRFIALAPLLAIVLIPATKKISNKIWFDHVEKGSEVVANKIGFTAENSFKNVSPEEAKKRWKFIHEAVAMDFGLGVPYAILHAFFYQKTVDFFAGRKKDKAAEKAADAAPQAETVQAVTDEPDAARKSFAEKAQPREKAQPHEKFTDYAKTTDTAQTGLAV